MKFHPKVTFLVGENGSGKSTLLEAIAVNLGMPAEGGSKNHQVKTFDSHSDFHEKIAIAKGPAPKDTFFLRAESLYNVATYLQQNSDGGGSFYGQVHARSHGEEFFGFFYNLQADGLFLFDEPEAALSIQRQLEFLSWLHLMTQERGCQFVIATHSPVILSYPEAQIFEFSSSGIRKTEYQETDPYVLMSTFIRNPERYLHRLLNLKEIEKSHPNPQD